MAAGYLQSATTEDDRAHLQARAERLAAAGEPFLSYFTPDDMATLLRTLGFTTVGDHAAQDVIDAYVGSSIDWARVHSERALRPSRIVRASR